MMRFRQIEPMKLRTNTLLAYYPSQRRLLIRTFRHIQVTSQACRRILGFKVRARTGYYTSKSHLKCVGRGALARRALKGRDLES